MFKKAAILCVFALMIVACVWNSRYMGKTITELTDSLSQVEDALDTGDYEAAQTRYDYFKELWQKRALPFGAILQHTNVDELGLEVEELGEQIRLKTEEGIFPTIARIRYSLNHIRQESNLSFIHIF